MRKAGVVGWPVAHSRSPLIHGHWLSLHGIDGRYDRIPLEPEAAPAFFAGLPASGLAGCNVTLPHKETAFRALERPDAIAARLGAANTLWLEDGRLCGTNTDVYGFLANLDDLNAGWDSGGGRALVIGAGGAARGIAEGLVSRGFDLVIANRTRDRAEALAELFPGRSSAHGLEGLEGLAAAATLIVNTTSLGLKGEGQVPLDFARLAPGPVVTDIVYVPLVTPFLAAARDAGHAVVDGLGMLLHQAVPGFERWFGVRPEVTPALRRLVEADLAS